MLKGWYSKTPESFIFMFKANCQITHKRKFKERRRDVLNLDTEAGRDLKPTSYFESAGPDFVWFLVPPTRR